jgi:hypothetical protein
VATLTPLSAGGEADSEIDLRRQPAHEDCRSHVVPSPSVSSAASRRRDKAPTSLGSTAAAVWGFLGQALPGVAGGSGSGGVGGGQPPRSPLLETVQKLPGQFLGAARNVISHWSGGAGRRGGLGWQHGDSEDEDGGGRLLRPAKILVGHSPPSST